MNRHIFKHYDTKKIKLFRIHLELVLKNCAL